MRFLASLLVGVLLLPLSAMAGPCDAHFKFDGDLTDAGGNGLSGQFVDARGELIESPGEFVPGKIGQALRFDGETVVLSELNLQTETCPKVSVTAWIFLEGFPKNSHTLLSTGHGRGPRMAVSNSNLSAWGGSNEIRASLALRPGIWTFVAGVWDYTADVHRLYWRHRSMEEPLGENSRAPQEGFWIGAYAYGSNMQGRANGVLIDDLQVHGTALSQDEIHAIRDAEIERGPGCNCGGSPAPIQPGVTPAPIEGPSCFTDNDCPSTGGFSGACYSLGGDRTQCYQRCDVDSDCGGGNACLSVTLPAGTLDSICRNPGSSGLGPILAPPDPSSGGLPEGPLDFPPPAEPSNPAPESAPQQGDAPSEGATPESAVPLPTGEPSYTGVAGFPGANQHPIDLVDDFVRGISWWEKNNRPCTMLILGVADASNQRSAKLGCDLYQGKDANVRLDGPDHLIGRLEVCNNKKSNRRLKGIRVVGDRVNPDGSTEFIPTADSDEHPNCATWSRSVLCPVGEYATGLVVHSNDATDTVEEITGLQLICRRAAQ